MIIDLWKFIFVYYLSLFSFCSGLCRLENRTITFNICNTPPSFILPVCTGYCDSLTQWDFRKNRFLTHTKLCHVTKHETILFTCPDSTHTSIELFIPL